MKRFSEFVERLQKLSDETGVYIEDLEWFYAPNLQTLDEIRDGRHESRRLYIENRDGRYGFDGEDDDQ
ncbi:hypothetical protein EBB07_28595 [Paenibacillaceae bacterium]|nr:hypothetical protein EBB07_28595 [Paenibacillaceae bacterium]